MINGLAISIRLVSEWSLDKGSIHTLCAISGPKKQSKFSLLRSYFFISFEQMNQSYFTFQQCQMLANTISLTCAKGKEDIGICFGSVEGVPAIRVKGLRVFVELLLEVIGVDLDFNYHALFNRNTSNVVIFDSLSFKYSSWRSKHSQSLLLYLIHVLQLF